MILICYVRLDVEFFIYGIILVIYKFLDLGLFKNFRLGKFNLILNLLK